MTDKSELTDSKLKYVAKQWMSIIPFVPQFLPGRQLEQLVLLLHTLHPIKASMLMEVSWLIIHMKLL